MKKKARVLIVAAIVVLLAVVLLVFGQGSEKMAKPVLTGTYDISPDETEVVYTTEKDGKTTVYWQNEGEEKGTIIASLEAPWSVTDVAFMPGGADIAIAANRADKENPESRVFLMNRKGVEQELLSTEGLIAEIAFTKNGDELYYLFAGVYTNYSPITGERPHDMDIYQLDVKTKETSRITNLKAYSMSSLALSSDEKVLYISMPGSGNAETAEEIFAEKDQLYAVELDGDRTAKPSFLTEDNVYEATIDPAGNRAAFIMIANPEEGGTYEYELYEKENGQKDATKLTNYKKLVTSPKYSRSGEHLYYMVNHTFPSRQPDFRLYRADGKGQNPEEITLSPAE